VSRVAPVRPVLPATGTIDWHADGLAGEQAWLVS